MSILLAMTPPAPPSSAVFMTPTMFWGPLALMFCVLFLGGH